MLSNRTAQILRHRFYLVRAVETLLTFSDTDAWEITCFPVCGRIIGQVITPCVAAACAVCGH